MSKKYEAPAGPPPGYPQQPPQAHYDAGPAGDVRGANEGYYGAPPPQQYGQPQNGQPPMGYGPPPGGQYQQQPMMYQQQGPYPPQGGYYGQPQGRGGSDGAGCCAGIMAALACCCCLDVLF